jgi:hypothetical protein
MAALEASRKKIVAGIFIGSPGPIVFCASV